MRVTGRKVPRMKDVADDIEDEDDRKKHSREGEWRMLWLKAWGHEVARDVYRKHFPKTLEIFDNIEAASVTFSILETNKNIVPHHGYFKGVWRFLMALQMTDGEKT